jgi:hypothetical protein
MFTKNTTAVIVSIIIFITAASLATDWKDDAKAVKVSGSYADTLILTKNKFPGHRAQFSLSPFSFPVGLRFL